MYGFKRLFILSFIIILLFSCFCSVKAESTSSQDVYRFVNVTKEENKNNYILDYRVYLNTGLFSGKINIPKNLYDTEHWFISIFGNGEIRYFNCVTDLEPSMFVFIDSQSSTAYHAGSSDGRKVIPFSYRVYNEETRTWSEQSASTTSWIYTGSKYPLHPNNILFVNNFGVKYCANQSSCENSADYSFGCDNQWFVSPELKYMVDNGFKLYLNDFIDFSISDDNYINTAIVESLYLTVYNIKTGTYEHENFNLIDYTDIQQDADGNYYVDILFNDLLTYMNKEDGDYLIFIASTLRSSYYSHAFDIIPPLQRNFYNFHTKYQSGDYWRYKYFSDIGSGLLVSIDNPDISEPPPEEKNETADAIKDQTQKIEEQTDAIKENTEVNKNIFQQIIELPGKIIELLLNALKSLFIPGDDFLSDYFDELYNWFCERLGFLSYPVQLFVDILDKFLNINWNEPVLNIPDISEPFTGEKLVSATTFNFNSLLTNDILKNVHDIYLILVDAVIIFALVNLAKSKFEEVTRS